MNLDDYQLEAQRTAPRELSAYPRAVREALEAGGPRELLDVFDVLIWGQGLAGEAGEVCDLLLKKVHGHGRAYDPEALLKELGDVLCYLANLASAHGFTLSEVAQANVDKLRARYPEGFTVAAANAPKPEQVAQWADPDVAYERVFAQPRVEKVVFATLGAPHDGTGGVE